MAFGDCVMKTQVSESAEKIEFLIENEEYMHFVKQSNGLIYF